MCLICDHLMVSDEFTDMPLTATCPCGEVQKVNQVLTHAEILEGYHCFVPQQAIHCSKCGQETPFIFIPCTGNLVQSLFGQYVQIGKDTTQNDKTEGSK